MLAGGGAGFVLFIGSAAPEHAEEPAGLLGA